MTRSMKFCSSGVALNLYKSIILPYLEYFGHVWVGAPNSYLDMLEKELKQRCRTVAPSLAISLEPLHLFYRYYFDRYSSELAE